MFQRTLTGPIVILVASSVLPQAAAQPAPVAVSLVSVTPATPSGDDDWCIGSATVSLAASVIDLSTQSEVAEGILVWQFCANPALGGLPKEECEATPRKGRWIGDILDDLAEESPATLNNVNPAVPVLGVRLLFRPAPGGEFKRTLSAPSNLDRTC